MAINFDEKVARKYLAIKSSAAKRNLEFNLSLTSIRNLLRSKRCAYTKEPLNSIPNDPYQLTIDRVDNNKGYVIGNVVACCAYINQKKERLTLEEIEGIAKVCERFRGE